MARTVDEKKRLELAYSAFQIIAQKGLFNTSLTDLSKGLQIKRTTLYWYFKSVPQIILEVFKDIKKQENDFLDEATKDLEDPIQWMTSIMHASFEFYKDKDAYLTVIFQLCGDGYDPDIQEFIQNDSQRLLGFRVETVERLQNWVEQGLLLPHQPTLIFDACLSFITGIILQNQEYQIDGKGLIELFVNGILRPLYTPKAQK